MGVAYFPYIVVGLVYSLSLIVQNGLPPVPWSLRGVSEDGGGGAREGPAHSPPLFNARQTQPSL